MTTFKIPEIWCNDKMYKVEVDFTAAERHCGYHRKPDPAEIVITKAEIYQGEWGGKWKPIDPDTVDNLFDKVYEHLENNLNKYL